MPFAEFQPVEPQLPDAFGCFIPLLCRVPARLLRRRSMKDQRRSHQLPDVTAHLSQLLSKACCQRIIHNLGRWFFQARMTRKWKQSYEKLRHGLKSLFETRSSTFSKKKKTFHVHWDASRPCSQVSVSAEPAGLRLSHSASLQQTPHVTSAKLPESCVLLQVFLNDLRSMFCLALLEAWCFHTALKLLSPSPKEATWMIQNSDTKYQMWRKLSTFFLILFRYSLPIKTTF